MSMQFELSPLEEKRAKKFQKKHFECDEYNLFRYTFTPTGIGDGVQIQCTGCGKTKDITDVGCW